MFDHVTVELREFLNRETVHITNQLYVNYDLPGLLAITASSIGNR